MHRQHNVHESPYSTVHRSGSGRMSEFPSPRLHTSRLPLHSHPRLPPTPGPLQSRRHASGRRRRLPLPRRRGVQPRASAPAGEAPRRPRRRLPSRLQVQARPAALQGAITWPLLVQQQCTGYGFRFRAGLSPLRSLNWGSDNSLNEHGLLAGLECELLLCAFRSHVVGYWGVEATAL